MKSDSMETTDQDLVINVKGIYEPASKKDGFRILVDRLWPRGLKKSQAGVDLWLKEIAPSAELRKSFNHDPGRWPNLLQTTTSSSIKTGKLPGNLSLWSSSTKKYHFCMLPKMNSLTTQLR